MQTVELKNKVEETFFSYFLKHKNQARSRKNTQHTSLCERHTTLKEACHKVLPQWNIIQTQITQQSVNIFSNYFTLVHIYMFSSQAPQNSYGLHTTNLCPCTGAAFRTLKYQEMKVYIGI